MTRLKVKGFYILNKQTLPLSASLGNEDACFLWCRY